MPETMPYEKKVTFKITDELRHTVFEYLDNLRESGATNMFGAGAWIEETFSLPKPVARRLLREWMTTFGDRHPHDE
jgi:hypothetical protein